MSNILSAIILNNSLPQQNNQNHTNDHSDLLMLGAMFFAVLGYQIMKHTEFCGRYSLPRRETVGQYLSRTHEPLLTTIVIRRNLSRISEGSEGNETPELSIL